MQMQIFKTKIIILGLITILFSLTRLNAAEEFTKGFVISPAVLDLLLNPGGTKVIGIDLLNKSKTDIANFKIYSAPINELEDLKELKGEEWSCIDWIEISPKKITLAPQEHKTIMVKITVPYNSSASGKYAVIFFEHLPEETPFLSKEDKRAVYIITWRIASLLRLTVSGVGIKKEAEITELEVLPSEIEKGKKLTFQLRVKNKGNIHIEPKGELIIRTGEGIRKNTISFGGVRIYPSQERELKVNYESSLPIGEYIAETVLNYGGVYPARKKIPFKITSLEEKEVIKPIYQERKIVVTPLSLEPEILNLNIPPQSFRTTHFILTNRYNYPVEITSMIEKDFPINIYPMTFVIPSGGSRKVMVEINAPKEEKEFKTAADFEVRNKNTNEFIKMLKGELNLKVEEIKK